MARRITGAAERPGLFGWASGVAMSAAVAGCAAGALTIALACSAPFPPARWALADGVEQRAVALLGGDSRSPALMWAHPPPASAAHAQYQPVEETGFRGAAQIAV